MRVRIIFETYTCEAELYDTITALAVYNSLPVEASNITTWGDEIYFSFPADVRMENDARTLLDAGELAFYPPMSVFCLFFGPTPMSANEQPVAAGEVNVFGKLKGADFDKLRTVRSGTVRVERAES